MQPSAPITTHRSPITPSTLIAFEDKIRALWEAGELPFLLHLCGGNEDSLLTLFEEIQPGDWIFSTHRAHYHYLCAGGSGEKLEAMIRAGRSMFVFDAALHFFASSILAGCCPIAAGVSWALKHNNPITNHQSPITARVWCFLGDGAEEEGHFYEAALFVESQDLPCTFIIEDNGRQVDTPLYERRGPYLHTRRPLDHFRCVRRYSYVSTYPHAGSGATNPKTFQPSAVERVLANGQDDRCGT